MSDPAQQRRRRALMLFAGLSSMRNWAQVSPMLYFFRTGYACEQPPTSEPGDEGWSGSEYCGDPHSVIGAAQRLSSTLLPMQLAVELIATPFFSALADNWNYRGVVAIGTVANVVGIGLLGLTAAEGSAAAEHYTPDAGSDANATTLMLPFGTLCSARIMLGISASAIPSATGALFLSLYPESQRGNTMVKLLSSRAVGASAGGGLGLSLVRLYLSDFTLCWLALTVLAAVAAVPLYWARPPAAHERHAPPPSSAVVKPTPSAGAGDDTGVLRLVRNSGMDGVCGNLCGGVSSAGSGGGGGGVRAAAATLMRSLAELLRVPLIRVLLVSVTLVIFGWMGAASILISYMQSAFGWRQGRAEMIIVGAGIPAGIVAVGIGRRYVQPKRGLVGLLQAGFACMLGGSVALCLVPWAPYVLVVHVMLMVPGVCALPCAFVLIAKAFPQHQQAQAQGLLEVAVAVGVGATIPLFGHALYDAKEEDPARQATPFVIAAIAVALGTGVMFTLGPRVETELPPSDGGSADVQLDARERERSEQEHATPLGLADDAETTKATEHNGDAALAHPDDVHV